MGLSEPCLCAHALLVASLTGKPESEEISDLDGQADVLEVRADLTGDLDPEWLRSLFPGQLLYTLRSRTEGGTSDASDLRRRERLETAAKHFDLVDLEGHRDLHPRLLEAIPPAQRLISWHGPPSSYSDLTSVFDQRATAEARYYKVVSAAEEPGQELGPLALANSLQRDDLIAFASGPVGAWTRTIAPRLGAPVVYGAVGEEPAAPGQPSLAKLQRDFCLPELPEVTRLFGLVGSPVAHSLSPALHNTGYRRLGIPALYLAFHVEAFGDFWLEIVESGSLEVLGFDLRGLSVTSPHKSAALAVAGAASPLADTVGSANTLIARSGVWEAESTDPDGVLGPLRSRAITIEGQAVAVVGAGGAGRAAAFALAHSGARVVIVNRGEARGRRVAAEIRVPFRPLEEFEPSRFDIVIHATPLGRQAEDEMPIDPAELGPETVVVDLVYRDSEPTRLVSETRASGRTAIDGREVLLYQALSQFRLMTGQSMPESPARKLLGFEG